MMLTEKIENFSSPILRAQKLTEAEAINFIVSLDEQPKSSSNKCIYLGLFRNKELIGLACFTFPQENLLKSRYTTQLTRIYFIDKFTFKQNFEFLVQEYYRVYHPADLVIRKEIFPAKLDIGHLGFNLFTIDKNRKVWEWFNPSLTFYTYRITATDSNKYYIGVSHVKKQEATVEDCLTDGYFGSGGKTRKNKFTNWKAKHSTALSKEILGIFSTKAEAYEAERELVGNRWQSDAQCLNSTRGGKDGRLNYDYNTNFHRAVCDKHGMATYTGKICLRCQQESTQNILECEVHGLTMHFGRTCCRCTAEKSNRIKDCPIHGKTIFNGNTCRRCSMGRQFQDTVCPIHGLTTFKNETCIKCKNSENVKFLTCETHGKCKHIGDRCYRCISMESKSIQRCPIHGNVAFVGESCLPCALVDRDVIDVCEIHGEALHRGGKCLTCKNQARVSVGQCEIHGEQKFLDEKCYKCINGGVIEKNYCETHGLTKHKKSTCCKCAVAAATTMRNCPIHGETKHRGQTCQKCTAKKSIHRAECPRHGETSFYGKTCRSCANEKRTHTIKHIEPLASCRFCSTENDN